MARYKAVILDDRYESHALERQELAKADADVVEVRTANPSEEEVLAACRDADAIVVNLAKLPGSVIRQLEKCRVIARYGVGFDNVDAKAATEKGIRVVNVPDYCMEEVSDQALALILACARQIRFRDEAIRAGKWDTAEAGPIYRIAGKTFGIVGFGNIPQALHRKLKGFDPGAVLVYDPFIPAEVVERAGAKLVDLDTLLRESDYISVHAPLTEKTRHMFGGEQFAKMKPTAIFVNTSRGGLVDTAALAEALEKGTIAWAGIDVHEQEPVPKDYPLLKMPNAVLSDHKGFYSEESLQELQRKAAACAAEVLMGRTPKSVVNRDVLK